MPRTYTEHKREFMADLASTLAGTCREANVRRPALLQRIAMERGLLATGNACGWDRSIMVDYCMRPESPSRWLGREVFEQSFDDGSMRYMSGWYDEAATIGGI